MLLLPRKKRRKKPGMRRTYFRLRPLPDRAFWPEVTSVTYPVRKYVLRMRNRKLRHIRPSGAFYPEVSKSRDRKRPCPEAVLIRSRFCACPAFPRVFFLVVVPWLPDVTEGLLTPFGVLLVCTCATGSCATPIVVNNVGWVFSTTSASYI